MGFSLYVMREVIVYTQQKGFATGGPKAKIN